MGHHHHGHFLLGQVPHHFQHLAHHLGVQSGGRLVKEHHIRLHAQRAHDGDPLLLAAGELAGIGVGPVRQTYPLQKAHSLGLGLLLALALQLHGRDGQILHNIHMGEQVELLEHHSHFLAVLVDVRVFVGDIHPLKKHVPLRWLLQQVQAAQKGALAGTRRSHHKYHVARMNIHVDSAQHVDGAEAFSKIFHTNQGFPVVISAHSASASSPISVSIS